MNTEAKAAKTVSQEQFKKLCEVAGLTEKQMNLCKSITVSCEHFSMLEVSVKYYVDAEEKE